MNAMELKQRECALFAEKAALIEANDEHEAAIAKNNVRLKAIRIQIVDLYKMENQQVKIESGDVK